MSRTGGGDVKPAGDRGLRSLIPEGPQGTRRGNPHARRWELLAPSGGGVLRWGQPPQGGHFGWNVNSTDFVSLGPTDTVTTCAPNVSWTASSM